MNCVYKGNLGIKPNPAGSEVEAEELDGGQRHLQQ